VKRLWVRSLLIGLLLLGGCVRAEEGPPDWVSSLAKYAVTESTGEAPKSVTLVETGERFIPLDAVQYGLSPDEKSVFLRTAGEDRDQQLLWIASKDEQQPRLLMNARWGIAWPTWSPAGDRIAFIEAHFDQLVHSAPLTPTTDIRGFSLVVADVETGATREVTPRWYYAEQYPGPIDWSPDGNAIAFNASMEPIAPEFTRNTQELYMAELTSEPPKINQLTKNDVADVDPAFSPDGNYVVFRRYEPAPFAQLILLDVQDGSETYVAGGGVRTPGRGRFSAGAPEWLSDSSGFLFRGHWSGEQNRLASLFSYDLITGATELVKRGELKH
jgi:Tol biopolymer transport system component